jgi:hypothetical protein
MSKLKLVWCRAMHDAIAYGGGDVYWCRKCLCRFPVPWVSARGKGANKPALVAIRSEVQTQPTHLAA